MRTAAKHATQKAQIRSVWVDVDCAISSGVAATSSTASHWLTGDPPNLATRSDTTIMQPPNADHCTMLANRSEP
jgi:hypothetical protein